MKMNILITTQGIPYWLTQKRLQVAATPKTPAMGNDSKCSEPKRELIQSIKH